MLLDALLTFVPLSGMSLVGGAGVTLYSSIIDELGVGVGVAPPGIIGNVSLFGSDIGVGDGYGNLKIRINTGTAFTTSNGATLQVGFQLAPDTGSAGNYQPGAWTTVQYSAVMTAAQLAANTVIARMDWPPAFPKSLRPRFARLAFIMPGTANFTAGTIGFAGVVPTRDELNSVNAANNYTMVT